MFSFRNKVILWCGSALFFLTFVVTNAIILSILFQLYRDEQKELRSLASTIHDQLTGKGGSRTDLNQDVEGRLEKNIDDKLAFLFDKDDFNMGYAIYNKNGELLHQYQRTSQSSLSPIPRSKKGFFFIVDSYEDWIFYYLETGNQYNVLVSSSHHLEAADKILLSLFLIFPINIILSIILGYYLSNKVLVHFKNISITASKIEKGDLTARVPVSNTHDEVADLIENLNDTFSRLQKSFNQINQFSSDAAHELKTPLTSIRGNLEVVLRRPRPQSEYEEVISSTIEETIALNHIVDQLLLLAKTGADIPDELFDDTNFSELVDQVLDQLIIIAQEKKIELKIDIAPGIHVFGIKIYLSQACYNLINNAIKFSPSKSIISVRLKSEEENALLDIEDQGIGISPADQEKIFDRFYQVDKSRQTGTGLGLSLVHSIVSIHRGSIKVNSELNKGSVFIVRIPIFA